MSDLRLIERLREMQTIRRNTTPLSVAIGLAQEAADRIEALEAEMARVWQDARRLDWIEQRQESIWSHWTNNAIGIPAMFLGFSVSVDDTPLPTARAAIDAAMAATSQDTPQAS